MLCLFVKYVALLFICHDIFHHCLFTTVHCYAPHLPFSIFHVLSPTPIKSPSFNTHRLFSSILRTR